MNKALIITLIILGGIGLVGLMLVGWYVSTYNGLVTLDEQVEAQWANVEVQYERRADLIPNLVATVQGAADFESGTQTAIAELRTAAARAKEQYDTAKASGDRQSQIAAAQEVDAVASRFAGLNINVENYPQLQATQNFATLQTQLEGTENRVSVERTRYNENVRQYNTRIRTIPTSLVASIAGFDAKELFEASEGSEQAPTVAFE